MTSLVAVSSAAEPLTRGAYVDQLETICKPGSQRTQRALDGVRLDVRKERNSIAAHKFDQGAVSFGSTVSKISKVARPEADSARLDDWFERLERQTQYMREMADQLRAGRNIKAQRLLGRFIHNGNLSNNITLGFEFDWCSFKFSRYG